MSYCAVNMQKYKAGDLGGLQSHNQREHDSRKNREIDKELSPFNFDTINKEDIGYHRRVKERISELNLKKAVRKDAVVYCSFIVGSDREFFERMARFEHLRRENEDPMIFNFLREPRDFDECDKEYRADCMRVAVEPFFRDATKFFQEKYGEENVMNGNVHIDEAGAPHMHLGVVPVVDGKLSAKQLFTPESLRQLQSDFYTEVGDKYDLERGREGSTAKHIDELTYKANARKADLEAWSEQARDACREASEASIRAYEEERRVRALQEREAALRDSAAKLEQQIKESEKRLDALESDVQWRHDTLDRLDTVGTRRFGSWAEWRKAIDDTKEQRADNRLFALLKKFIRLPQVKVLWEEFLASEERSKPIKRGQEKNIGR